MSWRRPGSRLGLAGLLLASGCGLGPAPPPTAPAIAALPVAVSNNAVAAVEFGDHFRLYSFLGLLPGKTWRDVTDRAFEYDSRTNAWTELRPVPGGVGRLAGTARTVAGKVYIFGGYTVAQDGSETSTPLVHRFDPETRRYHELPPMPVPVDDAVSAAYRDRYVYLVSGWHDTDNVSDVQVLDTVTESWLAATRYPGPPVFGHAGGLAVGTLVICDGVRVAPANSEAGRPRFVISKVCFAGAIDPIDPTRIDWRALPPHPGRPVYRAAAGVPPEAPDRVVFAGGTDNPFNYDGIGYDGVPSIARAAVFSYDPARAQWRTHRPLAIPSMDHRGLPTIAGGGFLIGGMDAAREPRAAITVVPLR